MNPYHFILTLITAALAGCTKMSPCSALSTFYILRHGETNANAANIIQGSSDISRLTITGQSQAEAVGYMGLVPGNTKKIDQIFVSPLTRARDTLSLVRKSAPPEMLPADEKQIHVVPNLREIDFYSWTYKSKDELEKNFPIEYAAWKRGDPDGLIVDGHKPLHEVWDRAADAWKEIREQCSKKDDGNGDTDDAKLLVCHGTLGQALLGSAFGNDATTFRKNVFSNCAMAEVLWNDDEDLATSWRWIKMCEE